MFIYLLLLLTLVPIVELALLFRIARAIDWMPTIALVLATGGIGAALARREGLRTLARIQGDLHDGKIPTDAVIEGVLILAAGLLLITPGVLTDAAGLFLLLPLFRRWSARTLKERFRRHIIVTHSMDSSAHAPADNGFIDVEVTDVRDTGGSREQDQEAIGRKPGESA